MKAKIEELKKEIKDIINNECCTSKNTYDFQDYTKEIEELKKFITESNITNIEITNNNGFGIAIIKKGV